MTATIKHVMVVLLVLLSDGKEEKSKSFASNNQEYQEYIDQLENKYSSKEVEKGIIIEGSDKVPTGVFDKIPMTRREMTSFEQFINVARRKRF